MDKSGAVVREKIRSRFEKPIAFSRGLVAELAGQLPERTNAERLAILLHQVLWLEEQDGRGVTKSYAAWAKQFPWLTVKQIRDGFDRLEIAGYLTTRTLPTRSALVVRSTDRCFDLGEGAPVSVTPETGGVTVTGRGSDVERRCNEKNSSELLPQTSSEGEDTSPDASLFEEKTKGQRPKAKGPGKAKTPCVACSGRGYPLTEVGCPLGYPYTDCKFCGGTGFEPTVAPELKPPKYTPEELALARWHFKTHGSGFVLNASGNVPRNEASLAAAFHRSRVPTAELQAAIRWAFEEQNWHCKELRDLVKLTTVPAALTGLRDDWDKAGRPGAAAAVAGDWVLDESEERR